MDKNILKQLYERKDSSRKKALLKVYKEIVLQDTSLEFICQLINSDLGANLVTISDLKYVRYWNRKNASKYTQSKVVTNEANRPIEPTKGKVSWTTEEEIINKKSSIISKFSK